MDKIYCGEIQINFSLRPSYNFSTTVQINDQVEQSDPVTNHDYSVLKDSKVKLFLVFIS